jgi:predicted DNA-binding transcriptional regulator AlpA
VVIDQLFFGQVVIDQLFARPPVTNNPSGAIRVADRRDQLISAQTTEEAMATKKDNAKEYPAPKLGFSIPEFCTSVGISLSFYYELAAKGEGPKTAVLGTRKIIPVEEAARWLRDRAA